MISMAMFGVRIASVVAILSMSVRKAASPARPERGLLGVGGHVCPGGSPIRTPTGPQIAATFTNEAGHRSRKGRAFLLSPPSFQ